jgi:hypothetical protein
MTFAVGMEGVFVSGADHDAATRFDSDPIPS